MKKVFQVSLIACAIGFSSMSQASLQQEMNQLFGSMTNTTAPGVFESQRRGVISGGSVVVRNRIMNENLVSMVPPSFQAGCGGIDMFAGSLSFINADQFVQLLRSVAANAKGYAFQLALSAMCEKCSQHMETLQKKIQQLNEYFGNSCQMEGAFWGCDVLLLINFILVFLIFRRLAGILACFSVIYDPLVNIFPHVILVPVKSVRSKNHEGV